MTAAGTIPPAKVLVLGAGVAGLQALATARRLGAQTTGYDVRPEVAEQVQSLGAKWLDLGIEAAGEGGYARELTEEERAQQQQALTDAIKTFDVVITTALVPGRPAPRLVTAEAVEGMKPGSVVVDLAGEAGGNCELTEPGRGRRPPRRDDRRAAEPAVRHARARLPALRAQRAVALLELMLDEDGNARPRLRRRGHRRRLRRARRGDRPRGRRARRWRPRPRCCVTNLAILVLAGFVGYAVISKVPNTLHTPLMSGTNAIHGIVVLGGLLVLGLEGDGVLNKLLLVIAIAFGTINVVGGFLVTDRMLEMFKGSRKEPVEADAEDGEPE